MPLPLMLSISNLRKSFHYNQKFDVRYRRLALIGPRIKQRADRRLISVPRALAEHMPNLPAVFRVPERSRKDSVPRRQYPLSEQLLITCFFPVVGKNRFVSGQKTPHQNQIPVIIHAHAHDLESLRRVLLRQFIQHGVLVAAGFAPRRPKRHEQRLSVVLPEQFLISLRVDEFWIAERRGLRRLRCGQSSRRGQQTEYCKTGLDSHGHSFSPHSIRTPAG